MHPFDVPKTERPKKPEWETQDAEEVLGKCLKLPVLFVEKRTWFRLSLEAIDRFFAQSILENKELRNSEVL